ncbi:unnamed protein product [Closterium sp. NIES-64]|nr:unnamed protein product [Closterium sp. NIES-64]
MTSGQVKNGCLSVSDVLEADNRIATASVAGSAADSAATGDSSGIPFVADRNRSSSSGRKMVRMSSHPCLTRASSFSPPPPIASRFPNDPSAFRDHDSNITTSPVGDWEAAEAQSGPSAASDAVPIDDEDSHYASGDPFFSSPLPLPERVSAGTDSQQQHQQQQQQQQHEKQGVRCDSGMGRSGVHLGHSLPRCRSEEAPSPFGSFHFAVGRGESYGRRQGESLGSPNGLFTGLLDEGCGGIGVGASSEAYEGEGHLRADVFDSTSSGSGSAREGGHEGGRGGVELIRASTDGVVQARRARKFTMAFMGAGMFHGRGKVRRSGRIEKKGGRGWGGESEVGSGEAGAREEEGADGCGRVGKGVRREEEEERAREEEGRRRRERVREEARQRRVAAILQHSRAPAEQLEKAAEQLEVADERLEVADERLEVADERLEVADERLEVADERLEVADERLEVADERLEVADERLEVADERLEVADERLEVADERLEVADERLEAAA